MRFALSTGSVYTYGLERVYALAAEVGFDGVELLIDMRFDTRQPAYVRQLRDRFALPVLAVHAPFSPWRLDGWPPSFPESIAEAARIARALDAGIVIAHLPRVREREYEQWLRQGLGPWQQAHPETVVAVENMPAKWFRWWPWGRLNPWRMNRLEEWSRFPYLNLDTTHLATRGLPLLQTYERLQRQVVHIHMSNAIHRGRRVLEHRRLDDGFLALDLFLRRLAQDNYPGVVTVELMPQVLDAQDEEKLRLKLREQVEFCRRYGEESR